MKQILFIFAALILIQAAQADDGSSGCGLGWQVAREPSILSSALRASTNATFLSPLAMTSGTSGCTRHRFVERDQEAMQFAKINHESLLLDMAQGRGEYVEALGAQIGCRDQAAFARSMQKNFSAIGGAASAPDLIRNVRGVISAEQQLRASCQTI